MKPAILLLLLAAAVTAQMASVDGVVVNHATGEPLSGVHVRLVTGDVLALGGADRAYGAISDKAGRFSVTGMQPGAYMVVLDRAGYLPAQIAAPAPIIALKAGQNLTGHKLAMNPRAMILGRVVDEYGDPVQRVEVEAQPVPPNRVIGAPFLSRYIASTDERGEFQLLSSPGKYYVVATPRAPDSDGPPEIRSDGSLPASYDATYYPSAAGAGSATVVQAGPGEDVAGIEIHLRRSAPAGPVVSVSGLVSGLPAGARANVTLRFGESPDALYDARSALTEPNGKFSFTGLHPASYSASARYSSGDTRLQSESLDFTLDSSGRADVQLTLNAGEELAGTLELPGDTPSGAAAEGRTVSLRPVVNGYGEGADLPSAETGKSGAFRLAHIHFGRFRVEIDPFPENAYIRSITLDGTLVPGSILDFSRGVSGSTLKVTLGLGAQISGKVRAHDGESSVSLLTEIMVWSGEKKDENEIPPEEVERVVDNVYSFKGLRPGKYRIVAIDTLEMGPSDDWDQTLQSYLNYAHDQRFGRWSLFNDAILV